MVPLLCGSPPLGFHFQGSTSPLSKSVDNHCASVISDFLVKYRCLAFKRLQLLRSFCLPPLPPSKSTFQLYSLWGILDSSPWTICEDIFVVLLDAALGKFLPSSLTWNHNTGCFDFLIPWWVIWLLRTLFHPVSRGLIEKSFVNVLHPLPYFCQVVPCKLESIWPSLIYSSF